MSTHIHKAQGVLSRVKLTVDRARVDERSGNSDQKYPQGKQAAQTLCRNAEYAEHGAAAGNFETEGKVYYAYPALCETLESG